MGLSQPRRQLVGDPPFLRISTVKIGVILLHQLSPGRVHRLQVRTIGDLEVGVILGQGLIFGVESSLWAAAVTAVPESTP